MWMVLRLSNPRPGIMPRQPWFIKLENLDNCWVTLRGWSCANCLEISCSYLEAPIIVAVEHVGLSYVQEIAGNQ